MADEDTQRVSWTLPVDMVEQVKAHQERHGFTTQSEAAADLFGKAGMTAGPSASSGQELTTSALGGSSILSREAGATSLGDERHSAPEFVDPHESYPTLPMVPPGETVRTISTDGAPIEEGTHGAIGDSEQVSDDVGDTGDGGAPDVDPQKPGSGTGDSQNPENK